MLPLSQTATAEVYYWGQQSQKFDTGTSLTWSNFGKEGLLHKNGKQWWWWWGQRCGGSDRGDSSSSSSSSSLKCAKQQQPQAYFMALNPGNLGKLMPDLSINNQSLSLLPAWLFCINFLHLPYSPQCFYTTG